MAWIKRNLALVISGVIALGLLGLGGWYLWSAMEKNSAIDNEINQTKAEIDRLLNMEPSPTASNLNNAKRELDRLTVFITDAKKLFPPTPAHSQPLTDESFKSLLDTTINDLHKQAAGVGIRVPTNDNAPPYYFTFDNQRLPVTFPPESLHPLSERLSEVRMIMSILTKARINRLNYIRRAVVSGERFQPGTQGNVSDYLNVSPRVNAEASMVLWPYEVDFDCFSSELGTVLEELERASYAFIVKSPVVTPAEDRQQFQPLRGPPRQPFGRPNPNAPNAPVPAVAPATLTTVINERLLRVTLRLEVVKPEGNQPGGGGPGQGRNQPGGGGGGPNRGGPNRGRPGNAP